MVKSAPGKAPGSVAALREHSIKPGEVRNKQGTNRWVKAQLRFRDFAMQPADEKNTRDDKILMAIYENALLEGPRGAADRTLWQEHMRGKAPKVPNDVEVAEHLRQVEKDRTSTVIACLGSKLRTMSPVEMRDFFETCANEPEKFIHRAEALLSGEPAQQQESPQIECPAIEATETEPKP
jgi:hypothetical protein